MRALVALTLVVIGCQRSPAPSATPNEGRATQAVEDASAPDAGGAADAGAGSAYRARTIPLVTAGGVVRLGNGPDFPAVNREGTEIVLLAHDLVDFAGTPVEHVVFLDARTGRRSADSMIYDEMSERDKDGAQLAELRRKYAANVAEASKRLAATTWRRLEAPSEEHDAAGPWASLAAARADAAPSLSIWFAPDLDLELPANSASETVPTLTIRRLHGTRIVPTTTRVRIPKLATQGGMTGTRGNRPCGWVQRVDGWADPERRFVLLALSPAVSGDECSIQLASDTLVLVPLSP